MHKLLQLAEGKCVTNGWTAAAGQQSNTTNNAHSAICLQSSDYIGLQ